MTQNNRRYCSTRTSPAFGPWRRRWVFTWVSLVLTIFAHACSLEEGKTKGVRGHTEVYEGVEHGFMARKGGRYCISCHGETLEGGENLEPSCYQCHGLNWFEEVKPDESRAPADHTKSEDGFRHHPNLESPKGFCTNCHGSALKGDATQMTPSCYLCHANVWD